MKRIISCILLTLALCTFIVSCGQKDNTGKNPIPEKATAQNQVAPSPSTPDEAQFIGEAKAKEIALEKAGLTENEVTFKKIELERDNGIWKYEVDFRKDTTEYDADIKADDGTILSFEVNRED